MPFKKGTPKPAGSGRKPGAIIKRLKSSGHTTLSRDVVARLEALGCDPIEGMALIALDSTAEKALRGRMFSELAQYVYPKRKAIEHSGPGGGPIQHASDPIESLLSELARLADRGSPQSDTPLAAG